MAQVVLWVLVVFGVWMDGVKGHGRLYEPPSRSSMWRRGYETLPNYNDNQLFCGGFSYQWGKQGGKCGICGDPYGETRDNEAGGKYATGIITRKYSKGQVFTVDVDITANHKGYFEFRICPNNDVKKAATQECLDRHLLQLADGSGTRYILKSTRVGHYKIDVRLPSDLSCTQCVLQWKWHVANSWGTNPGGRSCIGCGPQEEFYGCSDVAVGEDSDTDISLQPVNATTPKPTTTTSTTTTPTTTTTTRPTTTTTTPSPTTTTTTSTPTTTTTTTTPTTTTTTTTPTTTTTTPRPTTTTTSPRPTTTATSPRPTTTRPTTTNTPMPITEKPAVDQGVHGGKKCSPVGIWAIVPGMKAWCGVNCKAGYCPQTHCVCRV